MKSVNVSRAQIVVRGLRNHCPNCGGRTLFKGGTFFQLNTTCAKCGMTFARDDGFFLGATWLNYFITVICFLAPVMTLAYKHLIGETAAIAMAGVGSLGIPVLIFRPSRSWWLMSYYVFLPGQLPANQSSGASTDNGNT